MLDTEIDVEWNSDSSVSWMEEHDQWEYMRRRAEIEERIDRENADVISILSSVTSFEDEDSSYCMSEES